MRPTRALAWPALAWFVAFLAGPLLLVFALSFARRGTYGGVEWIFSFENYLRLMEPAVAGVLARSLMLALATGVVCVGTGLLVAWAMATSSAGARRVWFALIAVPFMTNLVIRVYAVKSFVGFEGPLQGAVRLLGFEVDPFALTANPGLVAYGMLTSYLPFAILPLYAAFERFDFALLEAARDLGANSWQQLRRVVAPVMAKPAGAAFALVAIPCLGEFVIPDLLGGARTMLLGNLITEKFLKARDWPSGAALAISLLGLFALARLGWLISRRAWAAAPTEMGRER